MHKQGSKDALLPSLQHPKMQFNSKVRDGEVGMQLGQRQVLAFSRRRAAEDAVANEGGMIEG